MDKLKFYRAAYYTQQIYVVYADSETDHFLVIKGRREKKETAHDSYFATFEKAKDALVGYWEREAKMAENRLAECQKLAENRLAECQKRLEKCKALKDDSQV